MWTREHLCTVISSNFVYNNGAMARYVVILEIRISDSVS